MDGEGGEILTKECREPSLIFIRESKAEAGLDRDGEGGRFFSALDTFDGKFWGLNHGGATAGLIDIFIGAAHVDIEAIKAKAL